MNYKKKIIGIFSFLMAISSVQALGSTEITEEKIMENLKSLEKNNFFMFEKTKTTSKGEKKLKYSNNVIVFGKDEYINSKAEDKLRVGTPSEIIRDTAGKNISIEKENTYILNNQEMNGLKIGGNNSVAINNGIVNGNAEGVVGGTLINNGTINGTLVSWGNGTAINRNKVNVKGDNAFGLRALEGIGLASIGKNFKTINVVGNNSIGMQAENGSVIINEKEAEIAVTGVAVKGMAVTGKNSKAINNGTIKINSDGEQESIGMDADNGAIAINNGTIDMTGNNVLGMRATNGSKIQNNGTILINGRENNHSMWKDGTSEIINSGEIISEGDIDFNDFGDGKFIISKGGTVKADSIKGDIYVSGAFALGSLDDEYNSYQALEGNDIDVNVHSNSYMFDVSEKNGDLHLSRKDFSQVINDKEVADILENNYTDETQKDNQDRIEYFDYLKLCEDRESLNYTVDLSTGRNFYPSILKQNYTGIKFINEEVFNSINSDVYDRGIRYIAGYDYKRIEEDSTADLIGFENSMSMVYFGADTPINNNLRVGGVFTVGKTEIDFENNAGENEGNIYQGNIYGIYENSGYKLTSSLILGKVEGDIIRTSLGESYKADLDGKFIGLTNRGIKNINYGAYYLQPQVDLSVIYYSQDSINENGGKFNLEIDEADYLNATLGAGLKAGRKWYFDGNVQVDWNVYGNYYLALDSQEDIKSRMQDENILSGEFKGNETGLDNDYLVLGSRLNITNSNIGVYFSTDYKIDKDYNQFTGSIGASYKF